MGGGGGGRLTTGFWRPPQAPGSSPGGYWGPGQRVREGLTTGFWPRAVGGGAPGGRSGWFPPGLAQLCMATGQQRLFLTGLMSVHGPGRMGEGPNSRPRRFLLAVPGGGGACGFECFGRRATSHGKTQAASSRWGTSASQGGGRRGRGRGSGSGFVGGGGARWKPPAAPTPPPPEVRPDACAPPPLPPTTPRHSGGRTPPLFSVLLRGLPLQGGCRRDGGCGARGRGGWAVFECPPPPPSCFWADGGRSLMYSGPHPHHPHGVWGHHHGKAGEDPPHHECRVSCTKPPRPLTVPAPPPHPRGRTTPPPLNDQGQTQTRTLSSTKCHTHSAFVASPASFSGDPPLRGGGGGTGTGAVGQEGQAGRTPHVKRLLLSNTTTSHVPPPRPHQSHV